MSFGSNSGNAIALKGLNGFNCLPSNSPKFNRQPSKKPIQFQPSNVQRSFRSFHLSRLPPTVLNLEVFTRSVSCSMDEAIREAFRLIPNKPTLKDRQRKCIADVFTST